MVAAYTRRFTVFFFQKVPSKFWKNVLSWQRDYNILVENIKEESVIVGKFDIADDFFVFNHILLLGKFYIYSQKCLNVLPSLKVLLPG